MPAKVATPSLLKTTVFWNKGYGVIIPVDDVTNKILSRDSNYIVDVFMWPKFRNSSISMREVIKQPQFYKDLTRKTVFLRGGLGSSSIIWDWYLVKTWSFTPCDKRVKTKSQKDLGANFYISRSSRRKRVRGSFYRPFPLPILNRVNTALTLLL